LFAADDLTDLPCDLCGLHDEKLLLLKPGVMTKHHFRVIKCRSCGFIYINPRLNYHKTTALYDGDYYAGLGFDPSVDYFTDYSKDDDAAKVFKPGEMAAWLPNFRPAPASLLDYGCGLGDFMRQAGLLGYAVEGFEISPVGREFCIRNGFRTYARTSEIPEGRYDIVTAIEVIEHVFSPTDMLNIVYRALRPGAIFLYTTGNIQMFEVKRALGLTNDWEYIAPEGHVNFFSPRTISRYFQKVGFSALGPPLLRPNSSLWRLIKYALKTPLGLYLPSAIK
jgi:2-polyprenyl-3-methyl-5-hydroxy-6-metoxy-1,4-benzoquinol methylase